MEPDWLPLKPPTPPECTHSDEDAVHAEVEQWVADWANRLYGACASLPGDGRLSRPRRAIGALDERLDEVRASMPKRFEGCVFASRSTIQNTIYGINDQMHPRPAPQSTEPSE